MKHLHALVLGALAVVGLGAMVTGLVLSSRASATFGAEREHRIRQARAAVVLALVLAAVLGAVAAWFYLYRARRPNPDLIAALRERNRAHAVAFEAASELHTLAARKEQSNTKHRQWRREMRSEFTRLKRDYQKLEEHKHILNQERPLRARTKTWHSF